MKTLEFYRQCTPIKVKDTKMKELEKCDCLSSVMTIAPILNIDREKMGAMMIMQVINDDVYVCICRVYWFFSKKIHHMNLSMAVILKN